MTIYSQILDSIEKGEPLLAVLMDPEKIEGSEVPSFLEKVNSSVATHIFVGGSTDRDRKIDSLVREIKKFTHLPVVLFPGNSDQVSDQADGILFLSLISGRNPDYLIQQQIDSALKIDHSNLEVIPTGYILINGGKETSVQIVSKTKPLEQNEHNLILKTALAGQYSGKKLIYLEAGSGALNPVHPDIISLVSKKVSIPLIVGGGIKSKKQLSDAYEAGAHMVVIGTAFENHPAFFNDIKKHTTHEHIR